MNGYDIECPSPRDMVRDKMGSAGIVWGRGGNYHFSHMSALG